MSSYFVGRSVDFTLIIAFLPFCALLIPIIVPLFNRALQGELQYRYLAAIPALAIFLALSFSFTALYQKNSPYSLTLSQCIHHSNCSPSALKEVFKERYLLEPMLDQSADPNFYDVSGLANEALSLIELYASEQKKIAIFLGIHPTTDWSIHTNTVLLLASKAHRWPISYVLSDEINPLRYHQVLSADVQLEIGEVIFVRSDEGRLGLLEAAILEQIRANAWLCPLRAVGELVVAYRINDDQSCNRDV